MFAVTPFFELGRRFCKRGGALNFLLDSKTAPRLVKAKIYITSSNEVIHTHKKECGT